MRLLTRARGVSRCARCFCRAEQQRRIEREVDLIRMYLRRAAKYALACDDANPARTDVYLAENLVECIERGAMYVKYLTAKEQDQVTALRRRYEAIKARHESMMREEEQRERVAQWELWRYRWRVAQSLLWGWASDGGEAARGDEGRGVDASTVPAADRRSHGKLD